MKLLRHLSLRVAFTSGVLLSTGLACSSGVPTASAGGPVGATALGGKTGGGGTAPAGGAPSSSSGGMATTLGLGGAANGGQAPDPAGVGGSLSGSGGAVAKPDGLPSEACSAGAVKPVDGYQDIQSNNEARRFILHLPPSYDGTKPFPVVFAFHSKGDDATQWDSVKFYYKVAAGADNVLVYMEALADPNLLGDRSFERDLADDLIYSDTVVAWLKQRVCYDQNRVFALGHSNGATFVQHLGCHRGHVFRAIATHAGSPADTMGCDGPVAAWVSVGDGDNAGQVATSQGRRDFWVKTNGCSESMSIPGDPTPPCVLYAGCSPGEPVEMCEDPLGDHKWSDWMSGSTARFFAGF